MKKTIAVLSIILMVIMAFAILLALAYLTILWNVVGDYVEAGPRLPVGKILYMLGCFAVAVVFVFSKKSKKIIIEVLSVLFWSVILPFADWLLNIIQRYVVFYQSGVTETTRIGVTEKVIQFPVGVMQVSVALFLVVGGMRIASKINCKKELDKEESA